MRIYLGAAPGVGKTFAMLDAGWRALAYCLMPQVIWLSLLPLVLAFAVIGGLARFFYDGFWRDYDAGAAWKCQYKATYGNKGQGTPAMDGENRTMWIFEPHAAEQACL